jgi:hypothetical protein
MRHKLAILAILLALGGVSAGVWRALHPPVGLFLVPGATDIQVLDMGMGAQLVTYHASGSAYTWRAAVERTLVQHGWVYPSWWLPGWPNPSYIYRVEFGLGALWSRADLYGEPNVARITIRRWAELPWWWDVPWRIVRGDRPTNR